MLNFWSDSIEKVKAVDLPDTPSPGRRYHQSGGPFPLGDAWALSAILQAYRPGQVVEIGSGFSTACMLDIAEQAELTLEITCIEPYPTRLKSLLKPHDWSHVHLLEQPVQSVPLDVFKALRANDILFIDSSHVLKTGSDVHCEIFRLFPVLVSGVIVHIHDCPYPFEYPDEWVFNWNHSWNEAYAIRAFLMFNERFRVLFWPTVLKMRFTQELRQSFPEFLKHATSSLWLRAT
jgi:hypothetical protein